MKIKFAGKTWKWLITDWWQVPLFIVGAILLIPAIPFLAFVYFCYEW